ncbi:MAG: HlyD family efflux transporter periplasmic adaptor subunit [Isosphaeraceae bacterium]
MARQPAVARQPAAARQPVAREEVAEPAAAGRGAGATGTTTTIATKPMIRSFTYMVPPYMPQRPQTKAATSNQQNNGMMGGMGGMGGGGGRGGGGGGMGGMMQEKPGSTRIISIVPEGKKVTAGEIVCELDSSAFRDELQAQRIRYAQAKAQVEQVQSVLDVNLITLREYQDGIYPQDALLIRQYLVSCRTEEERARKAVEWSKETAAKGYRSPTQLQADLLALEQAQFRLREAEGMEIRLEKFTKPRLITNLKAKIEAIKADKLAQESTLQLETDRLRRLETAVANCTLRAPRDGIVVYYNPPNMWGRLDAQIREGVTVREGQTLIQLPDPKNMRVRARINESKVALVQPGQKAMITVDAFPDRPLVGTVGEVTPIPSGANGPISDVKIYYATVNIDSGGFEDLRPGLSAEVTFLVQSNRRVTRVPLQAVRWVDNRPFVAVELAANATEQGGGWEWRSLEIGQTDPQFAEVVSGLKPGDRVVAQPSLLPPPRARRSDDAPSTPTVAGASSSSLPSS